MATYLERDVRTLLNVGDLTTFHRFIELCAGQTAQLLNLSSLAGECGISQPTAKAWLSVLETTFIIFRLPAYSRNIRKRLVENAPNFTSTTRDWPVGFWVFATRINSEIIRCVERFLKRGWYRRY